MGVRYVKQGGRKGQLNCGEVECNGQLSVVNGHLTGQAVLQKEITGNGKIDLNLLNLPSGLYTYKAIGNLGSLYGGKLIIAK